TPLYGVLHGFGIVQIAAHLLDAQSVQLRVIAAREASDRVSAGPQPAHDRSAEKTAAAGDERAHAHDGSFRAAHSASFSRPILALWRVSTGNPEWNRTCWIVRVWDRVAPSSSSAWRSCSRSASDLIQLRGSTQSTGRI